MKRQNDELSFDQRLEYNTSAHTLLPAHTFHDIEMCICVYILEFCYSKKKTEYIINRRE